MADREFLITKMGKKTIRIRADNGFIVDDWTDLTSPSCLVFGTGKFRIEQSQTVFYSVGSGDVFVLSGQPFGDDFSGAAKLLLAETGCETDGWAWKRVA